MLRRAGQWLSLLLCPVAAGEEQFQLEGFPEVAVLGRGFLCTAPGLQVKELEEKVRGLSLLMRLAEWQS